MTVASVTVTSVLSLIFAGGLLLAYFLMAPRYWRGEPATLQPREPLWWFLSPEAWWAVARSFPAVGPLIVATAAWGGLLSAVPEDSAAASVFGFGATISLVLTLGLTFSIARYNRPRRLVPPSRRSEPGLRDAS